MQIATFLINFTILLGFLSLPLVGIFSYVSAQDYHLGRYEETDTIQPPRGKERKMAIAQYDSVKNILNDFSSLNIGFNYTSALNFGGQTFDIRQFGFAPGLRYDHKYNFYALCTAHYWSEMENPWAKFDIGIGYDWDPFSWLSLETEYQRWFFVNGSADSRRSITNNIGTQLDLSFPYIDFKADVDFLFGTEKAWLINAEIDWDFEFKKVGRFDLISISPSVGVWLGTPNFLPINLDEADRFQSRGTTFHPLTMEFSLPVEFRIGPVTFTPAANYLLNFQYDKSDLIPNLFYFTLDVKYRLYGKKAFKKVRHYLSKFSGYR